MSRGVAIFKLTGTTGGSVDKLDSIDGATGGPGDSALQQGDVAFVMDGAGNFLPYQADADSGRAEIDPDVVGPDNNAGALRWILQKIKYLGNAVAESLSMAGSNPLAINGVPGGNTPLGAMLDWPLNEAPAGWIICDGSEVSRSTYSDLFAVIGTAFGGGDGATTFNLPDFRGRVPIGRDISDDDFNAIGNTGGEKRHELSIAEMPAHTHKYHDKYQGEGGNGHGDEAPISTNYKDDERESDSTGGGVAHNNLQPYLVVNKIMKC